MLHRNRLHVAAILLIGVSLYSCDLISSGPGSDCMCMEHEEACSTSLDCADSLICDGGSCEPITAGSSSGGGSCTSAGGFCSSSGECCGSAICISSTGRCHDSCDDSSECKSGCCANTDAGTGVCASSSNCN